MRLAALLLLVALAATSLPTLPNASAVAADAESAPAVTVLLFHPNDGVDPLGFAFEQSDPYTVRHGPLAAAAGRFDYPFFVADGILPIAALPDPQQPYASVRQAYGEAVAVRAAEETPLVLRLRSSLSGDAVGAHVEASSTSDLAAEDLRLWAALAEDPVHYEPPTGLTNGITDHRFTVRAIADLGPLRFSNGSAAAEWSVPLGAWERDRLLVAAWVESASPSPRFDAGEVVQATHAALGQSVEQGSKGVLAEVLSATWCEPCLYGDLAAEDLAVSLGAAQPLEAPRTRYLEAPAHPWVVVGLSVLAGLAIAATGRRRSP